MTAFPTRPSSSRHARIRRIAAASAVLAVAGGLVAAGAGAATAPTVRYTFTGRGWGHGLGMSQYGAEGMAAHGWTATQIMEWYFRSTTVGTIASVTPSTPIRVLMSSGAGSVQVGVTAAGTATNLTNGTTHALTANQTYTLSAVDLPTHTWVVRLTGPGITAADAVQAAGGFRITPGAGGLVTLGGRKYRGTLATTYGSGLRTVETVGIDDYVRGVVGWEMSSSWRPAALQAQALASRSYALASRRPTSYFDVYGGQPSEAYGGVAAETAATNAAVAATAGQVVTYGGKIVQTFYASSSGGHTESIQNVWGSTPEPYYTGVPDPYETAPDDPWPSPPVLTAAQLGHDLGLGAPVASIVVTKRGVSPRVMMTRVTLTTGRVVDVSGNTIEGDLGLMSTWFSITRSPSLVTAPSVAPTAIAGYVVTHFAYPRWHGVYRLLRTEATTHPGAVTAILGRGAGAPPSHATLAAFVATHYASWRRASALRRLSALPAVRQVRIMAAALVAGH